MAQPDIVILPSFSQAESWRKHHADEQACGVFAQAVTTFDAWIADLWELHGDGRELVGDMLRQLLMSVVLSQELQDAYTPGLAPLAASCMREAAGVPQFENVLHAAREGKAISGVSAQEAAFLRALARYEDALESMGCIEPGAASALLAQRSASVFPQPLHVLMTQAVPLTWIQAHFLSSVPQLKVSIEPAAGTDGIPQAPEGVAVRFAFPSGRLAQAGLVADEVMACAASGDVAVVCKDPLSMLAAAQDRLATQGLHVCAQARKPFAQTDFGRAFLSLHRCLHDNPWDKAALSDVLLSPFSGFSRSDAIAIDKSMRADRVLSRENVLANLRVQSEPFSQLEELASDPDADVLIGVFERMAQAAAGRSPAWRAEQLAAMGALREATSAARRVHAGINLCASALERSTVPVSLQVAGSGATVLFTTQPIAAQKDPGCFNALIVTDLTSEDYPVADRDNAATTLMAKLGMPPKESALTQARRAFCALCNLPQESLILMRPLGNDAADPTYPSAVLEEFVDAYREDASAVADIDNKYRLPASLQTGLVERGEQLLYANECAADASAVQPASCVVAYPRLESMEYSTEIVSEANNESPGASAFAIDHVSPSQIEVYLECPYQWFATRRLRIEELDEGFGPLERGSFAHAVLESFYRRFQESGHLKVNADNLEDARTLMRTVASETARAQFQAEPGSGRLVYASELERREVQALCNQLVSYLDFEAKLLPTFHPAYFEYVIDADLGVDYAGYRLVGKVDRIDVDENGRAVIIDYKGSVNEEHEIAGKGFAYAGKVQTRVYAQAVKRTLGLDVVGALYVSYGRKPAVSGAIDSRVIEAAHVPNMRHGRCSCGLLEPMPAELPDDFSLADLSFDCMLDTTEQLAREAMGRMRAGDVAPNPSSAKACSYCPVLACPKRGV